MPKNPVFKDHNRYIIIYTDWGGNICTDERVGARAAINAYREYKTYYGSTVQLTKVVLDYGEEV